MPTELEQAQARRIEELERRLAERNRVLEDVATAMAEEVRRREDAQEALIAAQKVEAIGHLAGGLAHDLRSVLLTVALGYDVLLQELQGDPLVEEVVRNGKAAVKQAGELVKRMLGFARPGPEQVKEVNLGEYLPSLEVLLGYAAGRQVAVRVRAEAGVWPVRVDEQGLGAALINLAVNARDAMPDGGELSVVAGNVPRDEARPAGVPAGDLVVIAVSDTGCGMTPAVLARATEPLFTTKPPGRGTGLGLYMAQRFALAAGGYLRLQSEPEVGTLVELYLPRWEAGATVAPSAPAVPDSPVLVAVEDDLARPGIAGPLREAGYRVLESSSAEAGLALAEALPRLALVVTDAGPAGDRLLRRLRLERPAVPALLLALPGASAPALGGAEVLGRPFSREALLRAVAAARGQTPTADGRAASMLDRLVVRLKSPEARAALLAWREARGTDLVPRLEAVQQVPPGLEADAFVAALEGDRADPSFRYLSVGRNLASTDGGRLEPVAPAGVPEDAAGTLASAYRRAARAGLPSYEYARYALGKEPPVQFERLILPASLDGRTVSHLVGLVLLRNLTPAAEAS